MKNQYTNKHRFFICSGFFLIVLACALSCFPSVSHTSFNGWTMQSTSGRDNFFAFIFLLIGIGESLLLFAKKVFLRILAVLLTLAKLFIPWLGFWMLNEIGQIAMDSKFSFSLLNGIPYVVTALTALLLIQHLIMLFVIPQKKHIRVSE